MSRRRLPSVDRILRHPATRGCVRRWGARTAKEAVRGVQASLRGGGTAPDWATDPGGYCAALEEHLALAVGHGQVPVFNLTGTLIHTNLGRSPLSPAAAEAALAAATRPGTLEYDLRTGARGQRESLVAHRLRLLAGAEAATAVNNNAAAVLLLLNTLAPGRSVVVSRGELIEIGGSFRLPELMESAGCRLREVGTTNRTHLRDYARALDAPGSDAALLLKVHPSNYRVRGFACEVPVRELAALGRARGVPICVDAGSGALTDLSRFGLRREPLPGELLDAGADLVTFSGDKLLGGVQAGLAVGRRDLVERLDANPLKRALRLDKIALALLDETLKCYEDESTLPERIPLYANLALPTRELQRRAEAVAQALGHLPDTRIEVLPAQAELGSGALPEDTVDSIAVAIAFDRPGALRAATAALRALRPAVIGRVRDERLWLDMRGAAPLDELTGLLAGFAP